MTPTSDLPDWNDLRDILLLAETGSLSAAARPLGVSQSTMSRRMAAIEAGGRPVFQRDEAGRSEPTARGEALLRAARVMQAAVRAAEAELTETPAPIRVAACEVTARLFVNDLVADWSEHFDAPTELLIQEDLSELSPSTYDIVTFVSADEAPPKGWVGSRVGEIEMGVYAAYSYLDRHPSRAGVKDLSGNRVIRPSGSLGDIPACQWFAGLGGMLALLSSSPIAQLGACARGQGVALLPTVLADEDGGFVRLDLPTCTAGHVWLVAVAAEASHPRLTTFLRRAHRFGVEREVVLPKSA